MRIVASYTTVPGRYEILEKSIDSLLNQPGAPEEIYLTVPEFFARTGEKYPELPDSIKKKVTIVSVDKDYGPICKIYGGLMREKDDSTVIITADDDTLFPSNYMRVMRRKCKEHPDKAICGTGALVGNGMFMISILSSVEPFNTMSFIPRFKCGENGRNIDICFGVGGVAYRRKFFPSSQQAIEEKILKYTSTKSIFHNDDVLISGYLAKCGISRRVFKDIPPVKHIMSEHALCGDFFSMFSRMKQSLADVEEQMGGYPTYEDVDYTDSPAYWIAVFIGILILFALFAFLVCWAGCKSTYCR